MDFFHLFAGLEAFEMAGDGAKATVGPNVGQLPFLDRYISLLYSPLGLQAGHLVFCARILFFGLSLLSLFRRSGLVRVGLALAYSLTVLTSQLDDYQHHLLVLALLVGQALAPSAALARSVACVQVGSVYLWAAVAKLNSAFSEDLMRWVSPWARGVALFVEKHTGIEDTDLFVALARATVAMEVALGAMFLLAAVYPLRPAVRAVSILAGVTLHVGMGMAGFDIGWFSEMMISLYALLLPEGWEKAARGAAARVVGSVLRPLPPALTLACVAVAAGGLHRGLAVLASCGVDGTASAALIVGPFVLVALSFGLRSRAAAYGVPLAVLALLATQAARVNPAGHFHLNLAQTALGAHPRPDFAAAVRHYLDAMAADPENAEIPADLGILCNEPSAAKGTACPRSFDLYQRAASIDPENLKAMVGSIAFYNARVAKKKITDEGVQELCVTSKYAYDKAVEALRVPCRNTACEARQQFAKFAKETLESMDNIKKVCRPDGGASDQQRPNGEGTMKASLNDLKNQKDGKKEI